MVPDGGGADWRDRLRCCWSDGDEVAQRALTVMTRACKLLLVVHTLGVLVVATTDLYTDWRPWLLFLTIILVFVSLPLNILCALLRRHLRLEAARRVQPVANSVEAFEAATKLVGAADVDGDGCCPVCLCPLVDCHASDEPAEEAAEHGVPSTSKPAVSTPPAARDPEAGARPCIRRLPCGHDFHADCIDAWALAGKPCPMCREVVPGVRPALGVAAPREAGAQILVLERRRQPRRHRRDGRPGRVEAEHGAVALAWARPH